MKKEELWAMAAKYEAKAERAYMNFQSTGISRYDKARREADDLASALRMAAEAEETCSALVGLRGAIATLTVQAMRAEGDPYKLEALRRDLTAMAKLHGISCGPIDTGWKGR